MEIKLLYFSIDGVLNTRKKMPNGYNKFELDNILVLDEILDYKEVHGIVSSSWRYMIHSGNMNLIGFRHMMMSHGMRNVDKIIGYINDDKYLKEFRAQQILDDVERWDVKKYLVVDDADFGFVERQMNFVQTDGTKGLEKWHKSVILKKLGLKK